MTTDRNLLFGVFAVLLGHVSPPELAAAAGDWIDDPSGDLSQRLEAAGKITPERRAFIGALIDEAIRANGGDISGAFAMIGGPDQVFRAFAGRLSCSFGPEGIRLDRPPYGAETFGAGVTETPGRYSVHSEHGRGGMGRVLLVHDEHMGRDVALKELLPDTALGDLETTLSAPVRRSLPVVARFLQEAKITAQLEHPAIVPVYELGHRMDGTAYYTMKLVRGRTLAEAIHRAKGLGERLTLLPHFLDLCNAVAYAHSRGVIHRDIKPGNVMVGEFGETVVLDWGLAKAKGQRDIHSEGFADAMRLVDLGDEGELTKTQYGHALGTPNYMPPEQAAGRLDSIDERSDVYSLGAVLYEMLTGRPPFRGSDAKSVILHVLHDAPLPVDAIAKDAPPELAAIAIRAMNKAPERRFASAKALADDIRRFQSGALVASYRYSFTAYTRFIWRRYKRQTLAAAAVALMAIAFAGAYTWSAVESSRTEQRLRIAAETANADLRWENYAFAMTAAQSNINRRDYPAALKILAECPPEYRDWEWGFLSRQCDPSILRIMDSDYDDPPYGNPGGCVLSDDGRYLLMHRFFSRMKHITDLTTGKIVYREITGDVYGWIRCTRFAPDGLSFTASLDDHRAGRWFWKTDGDTPSVVYDAGDTHLRSLVFNGDASLVAGYAVTPETGGAELIVWDGPTGAPISRFALSPIDGSLFLIPDEIHWAQMKMPIRGQVLGFIPGRDAVVIADSHVSVFDIGTGERRDILPAGVRAAYAPESGVVAAESPARDQVRVARIDDGAVLCAVPGGQNDPYDLHLRPDGRLLVLSGHDLQAYDLPSGELAYNSPHRVESGSFSKNGAVFLCLEAGTDYTQAQFLDALSPRDLTFRKPRDAQGVRLPTGMNTNLLGTDRGTPVHDYSADGLWLFTADEAGVARRWLADDLVLDRAWTIDSGPVSVIVASKDGNRALTASPRGVVLWNAVSGETILEIAPREGERPMGCDLSPDESRIAYAAQFGEVSTDGEDLARVYRADTGELEYAVSGHPGNSNLVAFSPDGQWLFTGGYGAPSVADEPSLYIWDAETGTRCAGTINAMNWPWRIEFSPDGSKALVMSLSIYTALYDLNAQKELYRFRVQDARQAIFLDGGDRIALGTIRSFTVHAAVDGRQLMRWDAGGYPLLRAPEPTAFLSARDQTHYLEWRAKPWNVRPRSEEFAEGLQRVRDRLGLTP